MHGVLHALFLQVLFIFASSIWLESANLVSFVNFIPKLFGGMLENISMPFLKPQKLREHKFHPHCF